MSIIGPESGASRGVVVSLHALVLSAGIAGAFALLPLLARLRVANDQPTQ